jgi:long-chain fatty acid transport protein
MNSCRTKFFAKTAMGLLIVMLLSQQLMAGGFSIYEQGARATAQAGAFTARPWDASAAFYNPAGLSMFGTPGQWRIYGGITPVQSLSKFRGLNPSPGVAVKDKAKDQVFFPFHLYSVYNINEKMAAAIAFTVPFGLGTFWDDPNYSGRFRSIKAEIQTVHISPTFSYKFNEKFSVGASIDYVYSKVTLKRNNPQTFFDGTNTVVYDVAQVNLEGTNDPSFGWHLAAFYQIDEQWSVGADYKHLLHNKYDGTAKFKQILTGNAAVDATVSSTLNSTAFGGLKQDGSTQVNTPNSIAVGVGYKHDEKWNVGVDFQYVGWSTFKQVFIEFPDNHVTPSSLLEEDYDNTWQIRFGGEYWFNDKIAGRVGYIYDRTPAPTETVNPLLPDANRNDLSLGIGYKLSDALHVDAAYMAVLFDERSTKGKNVDKYDGIYQSHVNLFSLSIGYAFGGK